MVDHALAYYSHFWIETPNGWPEIAHGHLKFALPGVCLAQPQSALSLAVLAVSHATFARARKSRTALTRGCSFYSEALLKTNLILGNTKLNEGLNDDLLLAVMLLSFYENSVTHNTSDQWNNIAQLMARSFIHHDGAMAMLKLRRQVSKANHSTELNKHVRRSLVRSALLRS